MLESESVVDGASNMVGRLEGSIDVGITVMVTWHA